MVKLSYKNSCVKLDAFSKRNSIFSSKSENVKKKRWLKPRRKEAHEYRSAGKQIKRTNQTLMDGLHKRRSQVEEFKSRESQKQEYEKDVYS